MERRAFLQLVGLAAGAVCTGQVGQGLEQVSVDHVGMSLEEMQDAHDAAVLRYAMTRPGAAWGPPLPRTVRSYDGGLTGIDIVTSRWEV